MAEEVGTPPGTVLAAGTVVRCVRDVFLVDHGAVGVVVGRIPSEPYDVLVEFPQGRWPMRLSEIRVVAQ